MKNKHYIEFLKEVEKLLDRGEVIDYINLHESMRHVWLIPDRLSEIFEICLLYTSPSPRDLSTSRMPSSA